MKLIEGVDFYYEGGYMVMTEKYHLDRGYCCGNGCRHCPYKKPPSETQGADFTTTQQPGENT